VPKAGRVLLLVLPALAAVACGTKSASSGLTVTPAAEKSAPLALPSVFPGRSLGSLSLRSDELAQGSARVLLTSADGSISLIAGRSRGNRLCAGAGSPLSGETAVRCLSAGERPPVIGFFAMSGRARPDAAAVRRSEKLTGTISVPGPGTDNPLLRHRLGVQSSSVVGLADPSTARVVLVLQNFSRKTLKLRRLPGLPWRAFSAGPYENIASDPGELSGLPSSLIAFDLRGRKLDEVELSWGYPNCRPDLCSYKSTKTGSWVIVRDPVASQQSARITVALQRQVRRLLFSDANVRQIVSGRQYSLGPLGYWQKCNGTMIGVDADVLLAYPVSIKGSLPYTFYENGTGSAYLEGRAFFDVENVRDLVVGIDLNRKKVVSIDPTIGDGVVVRSMRPVGVRHPAGGPDTANCGSEGD
jgi:hypothetical protein